jgi:hypothetical protein
MRGRALLLNRFTLVLGTLAVLIAAWNVYVALHAGGRLAGTVVDPQGRPVADATVVLGRKTVTSIDRLGEARTDAQGRFEFRDHGQYWVALSANKQGAGTSVRTMVPLWFRNQDAELEQPLVLVPNRL